MCESGNPQRDGVAKLAVKPLIMMNVYGRCYVIGFVISSGLSHIVSLICVWKINQLSVYMSIYLLELHSQITLSFTIHPYGGETGMER